MSSIKCRNPWGGILILILLYVNNACFAKEHAEPGSCVEAITTEVQIAEAAKYPGPSAEKKLKDLMKADFHYAQALYFLNREKAGFMAKERFEMAHDRALGDIRTLVAEKDDTQRIQEAQTARQSWLGGFRRARVKDVPR